MPLIIDPPEGWKYGFPKPIPDGVMKNDTLFRIWMSEQGYPNDQIDMAMRYSRYWESKEEFGAEGKFR